jgi:hypothetical protein
VIAAMVAIVGIGIWNIRVPGSVNSWSGWCRCSTSVNDIVFLGLAIYFLITLETRLKRRKALRALQPLRASSTSWTCTSHQGSGTTHVAAAGYDIVTGARDECAGAWTVSRLLQ